MSATCLTRKFKQEMEVTPHQFLLLRRIEKAKSLLTNTDLEIVNIAMDCGFAHQSHFTRHFSGIVGASPLKFRQHARRKPEFRV